MGAGVLFFGGIAVVHLRICSGLKFWEHYALPLAYAVVSGGIAIGLLATAIRSVWRAVRKEAR